LGLWIVLPSGWALRFAVPEARLTTVMPFIKLINSIVLLLLNYLNGAVSFPGGGGPHFDFGGDAGITTGLCVTAFASGYGLSRLFKVDQADRFCQ
jgi:BASS family bile acid:Na+ symporter